MATIDDKFIKGPANHATTLSSGINDSVQTIPFSDVTGVPTDTPVYVAIDAHDANGTPTPDNAEVVKVLISGSNGTNAVRGAEGTAQAHSAGAAVEFFFTAAANNDIVDGILEQHNADGTHGVVTATSVDVNGGADAIILDADADTTISAPTDDQIDFEINGADDFRMTANTFTALTGSSIALADSGALATQGEAMLKNVSHYTDTGTWSKPSGLKFVVVEVQGGGGGSGGTAATSGSQVAVSGGGGGGAYVRKKIAAGDLASSETVTVGGAGNAGTAGANAGGTGGNSSFGSHVTANGGSGSAGGAASANAELRSGGGGGAASGGDLNVNGGTGGGGFQIAAPMYIPTAFGGSSVLSTSQPAGGAGKTYGGGGGGRWALPSSSATAGFAGAPGIVIVHEYF